MKLSAPSVVSILIAYQGWCGEKIVTLDRAESVIDVLTELLLKHTNKYEAARWLFNEGWADTVAKPKELVNVLWPLKATVRAEYSMFMVRATGGSNDV